MQLVRQLPASRLSASITPYQTWGYFLQEQSNTHQIKIAKLEIITGSVFLLQAIFAFFTLSNNQGNYGWFWLLEFIGIVALWIVTGKLFKNKAPLAASLTIVGEFVSFFLLIPPGTWFVPWLFILTVGFIGYGIRQIIIIKNAPPLLTDLEFDAWVEQRAREGLINTIYKLGLEEEIRSSNDLLCVRGYVLPGMRSSRHYNHRDLRTKLGADGRWRYSVNIYTYFYAAEHQIMAFIYDINAMNWADYREATKEYFYEDVIGATTEDEQDTIYINGMLFNYRAQRFSLRLCDGYGVGATVRSIPLDDIAGLPTFDRLDSGVDRTIAQLRMLLRTRKWRTS